MVADPASKVPIGTVLVSKYRITREIGRGGMAAVYEAENVSIGKRVAVKLLSSELVTSRIVRERFMREARAAAAVRSPYICDVYDVGEFDGRPFLVMELLEGESLYDLMSRVRRLDTEQTLKITIQTAKGLAKAHASHIVHRDLKPENLFLTHNEDGEVVAKVLDFGLAKFYVPSDEGAEQVRLTREGALFGTPAYMSPEQAKGKGEVDHRSDLWALGCIVYECLTGQTVWNVDQGVAMILAQVANSPLPIPSQLRPDLPNGFDEWFATALSRDPNQRFQTAREFAVSLADVLSPTHKESVQTPSLLVDVDELTSRVSSERISSPRNSRPNNPNLPSNPINSRPITTPPGAANALPAPALGSSAPAHRWRSSGALWASLVLLAAAGGAFWGYRKWRHPHGNTAAGQSTIKTSKPVVNSGKELDGVPYADAIAAAQDSIIGGDFQSAFDHLETAIRNGGEGVAKNFRSHLRMALDNPGSPCHLTALAHPRPLTANTSEEATKASTDVSRPTVIDTAAGVLVGWAQRQVFTTLLDARLRPKDKPQIAAPEAANARHPQLAMVGGNLTLLFWNGVGSEPGVFIRTVDAQGHPTSPTRRVGPIGRSNYSPSFAAAPDSTTWVVWEDDSIGGATNLVARHLDRDLAPIGSVIQLTSLIPDRNTKPGAVKPSIAIAGGKLNVAFVLRKQGVKKVQWMSIDLSSPELQTGLTAVKGKTLDKDRYLGKLRALDSAAAAGESRQDAGIARPSAKSKNQASSDDIRLSCRDSYCVAAWNDTSGIQVAYLDPKATDVVWQRGVGSHGVRATASAIADRAAVVWYEPTQSQEVARVQMAIATRSGLNQTSIIGKVSGRDVQPYPDAAPSRNPNQWYIAWRDYESGRLEAVLARIECNAN